MYKVDVYINGERLDLFDNETISVISSVQNINDISRNFNDFSQSFTVPASNRNNKILKHFYNAYINEGFDARVRHDASLFVATQLFRLGSIRLDKCELENHVPKSYTLTFFGLLVSLKESIGDEFLSSLDLSEYDQTYSSANVLTGLKTGFFTQDYIYPLISTQRQYFYNSNASSTTQTETLANIAWNGAASVHGVSWDELRPALKVMRIIEAIESRYGITFSRDFFGTIPFDNLYLWLANQDTEDSLKTTHKVINYTASIRPQPSFGNFDNSVGIYYPTAGNAFKIREIIVQTESSDGVFYTVQIMNGASVLSEQSGTGNINMSLVMPDGVAAGSELYVQIQVSTSKTITQVYFEIEEFSDDDILNAFKGSTFVIEGAEAKAFNFVPQIKVIDFIKSLVNKYNLVVIPASKTEYTIKTLDEWYDEGDIIDVTEFIDTSQTTVSRSKIFREIDFTFQEPQTILAEAFARMHNIRYGDLSTKLKNLDGTPLDGDVFEIELSFEQMLYERLFNLNSQAVTNIVYGLSVDGGLSPEIPEAHLFYALSVNVSANSIAFIDQFNAKSQINTSIFMPSHANNLAADYTTTFGSEINEHTGSLMTNSLFKLFYLDYITDSFNPKRRMYDYTAKLPAHIISTIKVNDRLVIRGDRYIINQMTTNITTGIVKLELLNDIFGDIENLIVEEQTPIPRTPEVITGEGFYISSSGDATSTGGCLLSPSVLKYHDGLDLAPTLANIIYNDVGLTTPFDGGWLYYKIENNKALRINNDGRVIDVWNCIAMASE